MKKSHPSCCPDAAHTIITDLVPLGSRVLDLGCGNGDLLQTLITTKGVKGSGVEIDPDCVTACVQKGIPVFQGNIDEGLKEYPDNAYDIVVLNQTLQAVHHTELVLREMLRVGKTALVGIPNFAHWRIRASLLVTGRLPVTRVYNFQWYDTPNIRLTTVSDFTSLCGRIGAKITRRIGFRCGGESSPLAQLAPNLFCENALFILTRDP